MFVLPDGCGVSPVKDFRHSRIAPERAFSNEQKVGEALAECYCARCIKQKQSLNNPSHKFKMRLPAQAERL
ncbi:hypothetical protein BSPA111_15050 [Buttiauxella sp. A111]|nr:hypothetical protein BSPA111_15050 [Buttiauxella sp. A111]